MNFEEVKAIVARIKMECFDTVFGIKTSMDMEFPDSQRVFIQVIYVAECNKTNDIKEWHGRKWYLSRHMTADEVVKTAYAAFEAAVKHEVMEGFKVDGKVLFNPHVSFEALLNICDQEVSRAEPKAVVSASLDGCPFMYCDKKPKCESNCRYNLKNCGTL
jgi:hypothetical protein